MLCYRRDCHLKIKKIVLLTCSWLSFTLLTAQEPVMDSEAQLTNLDGTRKIEMLQKLALNTPQIPLDKQLSFAKEALNLSIETGSGQLQAESLRILGDIHYERKGNYEKAIQYYQDSLKVSENNQDEEGIAESLNKIGLTHRRLRHYGEALDFLSRSLEIREKRGDKKSIAASLNNIGLLYKSLNNYEKALEYSLKALQIKEELGDKKGISASLNNIGLIHYHQGENQEALDYLQRSLKIKEELGDREAAGVSLNNIGLLYTRLFNYDKALEALVRSFEIRESLGDKKGMSNTASNIGSIYQELEDYQKALEYFQDALKINRDIGNNEGIASTMNHIGLLYIYLKDFEKALDYLKEAKELNGQQKDRKGTAESLDNMGLVYKSLKKFDIALEYHQEAMKINQEIEEKEGLSLCLKHIGDLYCDTNRYEAALSNYLGSLEIEKKIGNRNRTAEISARIGEILLTSKNYSRAKGYLDNSLKIAKEIDARDTLKDCYQYLSSLYYETKEYQQACDYYKLFQETKDSIMNRERQNQFAKLQARLDAESGKQANEIEILKKENEIKALTLNRQKLLQAFLAVGFFLFLILILMILYVYQKTKKTGKQLAVALEETRREIEERKKLEKEKEHLQEQLFHAQKLESMGRMAGGIAHEFNNLLASIMGYADMLKMKYTDKKEIEGRAADVIYRASLNAKELTEGLLGFARRGRYNPVSINLNELIKSISDKLEKKSAENIQIEYQLNDSIETVKADKNQMIQVFTNLILNAKEAMPEGGKITFKTENIHVDEKNGAYPEIIQPGDYVRLSITDTGIGMTKEIQDRIFDPFFTTKGIGKGTGLGLSTAYGILKNHNGHIFCQSEPGQGSTFYVYIPQLKKGLLADADDKRDKLPGERTVLVVDDEDVVLYATKDMLERLGYEVLMAADGYQAIDTFKKVKNRIDLVLLDIIMPDKDGKQTFDELKALDANVKVLLFSGLNRHEKLDQMLSSGALGFLKKPFDMNQLSAAVSKALKNS